MEKVTLYIIGYIFAKPGIWFDFFEIQYALQEVCVSVCIVCTVGKCNLKWKCNESVSCNNYLMSRDLR